MEKSRRKSPLFSLCKWSSESAPSMRSRQISRAQAAVRGRFPMRQRPVLLLSGLQVDCSDNEMGRRQTSEVEIRAQPSLAAIGQFMRDQDVVSVVMNGPLDRQEYFVRLKRLMRFIGSRLSNEQVRTVGRRMMKKSATFQIQRVWHSRRSRAATVQDNLNELLAEAACHFDEQQLRHLLSLLRASWRREDDRGRQRILALVRTVGRTRELAEEARASLCAVAWQLLIEHCHPSLTPRLMQAALYTNYDIINAGASISNRFSFSFYLQNPMRCSAKSTQMRRLICWPTRQLTFRILRDCSSTCKFYWSWREVPPRRRSSWSSGQPRE